MKTVLEAAALGKEAPIKNFDISKKQRDKHKALFAKIKTNLHENSYGITFDDLVKDGKLIFEESGASFKFLEIFNQEIINKTEVGKYILSVLNNEQTRPEELKRTFSTEFGRILTDHFTTMLDNAMEQWEQLGLFEVALDKNKQPYLKHLSRLTLSNTASLIKKLQAKDSSLKDPKNIEKLNEKIIETLKEEARPQLEEWLWNDTFATINIIEITATDLAYYKNVEDFQKRYAQLHSPTNKLNTSATFTQNGKEIRYSADGLSRTMYIADNTVISDMIASVETIFDRKIEEAKRNGNKEQAKQLERLKSVIIDSKDGFKNINVADAQGYSSPTSYRKKLGMMGQWTDEMERAYEEIRNGNWNIENFNVIWQPLKPFVYTKIHKNTDGLTLETLPVPSQHKNSEYLLLMADAIISSDREIAKTNKLKGIFDFMEATAYTKGQYNGIGIDTIQFESAIKSGLSGVVDINQATTANEVFDILVEHARGRKDVDEIYNENYVHTFEFSDYGIQQPVPAHLQGQQLMGSQIRILSVSDIQNPNVLINVSDKNGNQMTMGQARDEYMALVAENIRESYNTLVKELHLKGTRKQQNEALAQLLREAILKDQRFGGDLLFACELNKDGEFNIPLNDPIQSVRIQQLLNSIIKSRINKQKIAGGPVVQTSMYGLDQDLSIRFKTKDGQLLDTYKEWCQKHNKKMNEASAKAYKKYVSGEQGSLAYYECLLPIPDSEMQKALTKTDGSLMSVEEALNAGIISEECLEAIGYRIPTEDKYSMYPMKIVGFLPSSEEIIMLPKEITLITGSDFDIDKTYIILKQFKKGKIDFKKLKEYLKSQKIKNANDVVTQIRDFIKDGGTMYEALQYLDSHASIAVQEYLKANVSTKLFERDDEGSNGRNNRIFDLMYAILTSEETADKMFNPGSFNTQKRSARIITILKNNPGKYTYKQLQAMELEELEDLADAASKQNITSVLTQVAFHKQNMTAGKLIGIFANNNTSHAFLSMQNISLNFADNGFNFDGISVTNHQNNKLDNIVALDGFTLISKNIAGFLAASVDAVKDPVLNYMNLNTCTSGVAMLLARLGFDSDSIGLFLTQPIIEELTRKWITINNSGYASISDVIGQMLLKYEAAHVESLRKSLNQESFNKEKFAKQFSKPNTDFEIRTLLLFEKLSGTAQHLSTLTFLTKFNSVTNAVGPMIADTLVMENRKNHFINEVMNSDNPPFSYEAKYVIENNPILEAFYETTVGENGASKLIFQNHFPHYSAGFQSLLQQLTQVVKAPLDSKTINNLVNFYMLYKMSMESESQVYNGSYESRREFMLEFPRVFEERVRNIKNGNLLLDVITLQPKTKKCPTVTLSAKTGGYTTDIQENIKHAWADLMQTDPQLAIDLFKYNMYRTGFTFSPKTFLHLASSFVKLNIPGYVDCLRDPEFLDENLIGLEFEILMQFLRNYMDSYKLVPRVNNVGITKSDKKPYIIVDIGKNGNKQVLINTKGDSKFVAPVIVYDDILYYTEQSELTNGEQQVYYYPTTRLGVQHDFIEVDGTEQDSANMTSVFSKNNKKNGNKKKIKTPEKLPPSDNDSQDMTPQKTDTDYVITGKDKEVINKSLNTLRSYGLMHNKDEQQLKDLETIPDVVKFITHLYNQIEKPGIQLSKYKELIIELNKKICKS